MAHPVPCVSKMLVIGTNENTHVRTRSEICDRTG